MKAQILQTELSIYQLAEPLRMSAFGADKLDLNEHLKIELEHLEELEEQVNEYGVLEVLDGFYGKSNNKSY